MDFSEGLGLTVLGIGTVFITMIGLAIIFEILNKVFSASTKHTPHKAETNLPVQKIQQNNNLAAAIIAAIECYSKKTTLSVPRINHCEEQWAASCKNFTMISNRER